MLPLAHVIEQAAVKCCVLHLPQGYVQASPPVSCYLNGLLQWRHHWLITFSPVLDQQMVILLVVVVVLLVRTLECFSKWLAEYITQHVG